MLRELRWFLRETTRAEFIKTLVVLTVVLTFGTIAFVSDVRNIDSWLSRQVFVQVCRMPL